MCNCVRSPKTLRATLGHLELSTWLLMGKFMFILAPVFLCSLLGQERVPMSHFLIPSCPHPSPASQHNQCLTAVSSASPGSFTQSSSSIILSVCRSSRPSHSNLWVWKVFPEERAEDDRRPWWIITGLRPGSRRSCRGWAAMVAGELMGEVVPGRERWVGSPPFEEASEGLVGLKKSWGLVLISHTTRSSPKLELTEIVEDKTVQYFVELKAKRLSQSDVKINQAVKMLLLITHSKMVKERKSGNPHFFQNRSPCTRFFHFTKSKAEHKSIFFLKEYQHLKGPLKHQLSLSKLFSQGFIVITVTAAMKAEDVFYFI